MTESAAFFSVNGSRVVSGRITIPLYGAWVGDIVLAVSDDFAPGSSITIALGSLTLKGTIARSAGFSGSRTMRIIGGGAGWRNTIEAKGYSHDAGVKLSAVLEDAARSAGEQIVVDKDRGLGSFYVRQADTAERVLKNTIGDAWWIDNDGVTQTKARATGAIVTPFTVINYSGGKGQFEIATEAYQDWMPGRSFSNSLVTEEQTISSVSFVADKGKIQVLVQNSSASEERVLRCIRAISRDEASAAKYFATWEYTVNADPISLGLFSTLELTSTVDSMPDLSKVPLAPELGTVAVPPAGTTCRVRFVNGDPGKPEVISLGATTEHLMTAEACSLLIYNTLVAWCAAAGGGPLLAAVLQPLIMPAILAALAAQGAPAPPGLIAQTILSATLAGTMATGTTPSPTSLPFNAAIAALSAKTLDVSGAFPSVGIPQSST